MQPENSAVLERFRVERPTGMFAGPAYEARHEERGGDDTNTRATVPLTYQVSQTAAIAPCWLGHPEVPHHPHVLVLEGVAMLQVESRMTCLDANALP
jgi:hypothetical protein